MVIAHGHTTYSIGGMMLPVQQAAFTTGVGTTDVVAAVAGHHIVILGIWHANASASTTNYLSGANILWVNQHANAQSVSFRSKGGVMIAETNAGEAFRIQIGTGTIYGTVIYAVRPAV